MRLDKYLAQLNIGTRSQVKELIRKKKVSVNQLIITSPDYSVDPQKDQVSCQGKSLTYSEFQYYVLNKPAGIVSATKDAISETVLSLLP